MLIDYHVHSDFSYDSENTLDDIARGALARGISEIGLADHLDDYFSMPERKIDLAKRQKALEEFTCRGVKIMPFIEIDLFRDHDKNKKLYGLIKDVKIDCVLGSVHNVNGLDPYEHVYYEGRDTISSARDYLEEIALLVKDEDGFDILGHFDYPQKCSPVPYVTKYSYAPDVFDAIFRALISRGKGMELNTSAYRHLDKIEFDVNILKRYRELGGELLTIGSDSHRKTQIGDFIKEGFEFIKLAGFKYITTFENRRPSFELID